MTSLIVAQRLAAHGLAMDAAPSKAAWHEPVVRAGGLVECSGQVAVKDGQLLAVGRLGEEVSLEVGVRCAAQCAANALAQLDRALGDLALVSRLVRLTVYVASSPEFHDQSTVANGASELLREVMGTAGRHCRAAIGVAALPIGSPVELSLSALVDPPAEKRVAS